MKLHQKYLSYLYDITLETTQSPHNPHLQVVASRGRVRLDTKNATYSHEDLYTNFYQCFQQIKISQQTLQNVLVLGLGLGSIPLMLEQNFKQNAQYQAVEIDPIIIQLAQKYMPSPILQKTKITQADAFNFIENPPTATKFDLIAIDIFIDDKIPQNIQTQNFLKNTQKILKTKGILIFNHLNNKSQTQEFYNQIFSKTLPNTKLITLKHNTMMHYQKLEENQ